MTLPPSTPAKVAAPEVPAVPIYSASSRSADVEEARHYTLPILFGLAILGCLAVLLSARPLLHFSTDSVYYIDGARSLARGEGYTTWIIGRAQPIVHWPPMYSVVLAGFGLIGIDPMHGARFLAAVLFGANVFLVGWLVRRHGSGGALPALAASLLVLVSADLLEIHAWAWSEPLFILLSLLAVHQLATYLEQPGARRRLLLAAALVGIATVTRFVGVSLIIGGGVAILWLTSGPWFRRVARATLFGLVASVPLGLWILRNYLLSGRTSGRDLVVNPLGLAHLETAARTVAAWLVPPFVPGPIRLVLLLALLASIGFALVRRRELLRETLRSRGALLLKLLFCLSGAYVAFVAVSIMLFDADVAFDSRILSPVHILLLVAVGLVLAGTRSVPRWTYAALGVVALLLAAQTFAWARAVQGGIGYSSQPIRESEVWGLVRAGASSAAAVAR